MSTKRKEGDYEWTEGSKMRTVLMKKRFKPIGQAEIARRVASGEWDEDNLPWKENVYDMPIIPGSNRHTLEAYRNRGFEEVGASDTQEAQRKAELEAARADERKRVLAEMQAERELQDRVIAAEAKADCELQDEAPLEPIKKQGRIWPKTCIRCKKGFDATHWNAKFCPVCRLARDKEIEEKITGKVVGATV